MYLTQHDKSPWRDHVLADFRDFRFSWGGFLRWALVVLGAAVLAALITLYFLDWNELRGPIGAYASRRAGREVRIEGNLKVDLFRLQPHVSVDDLVIGNSAWVKDGPPAALVPHGEVEFRLFPALVGHWILPLVRLDRPQLLLVRDTQGRTNWDSDTKGSAAKWKIPPIQRFLISGGHLEIDDQVRKLKFLGTISSEENAGGGKSAFLINGDGSLNGNKFLAEAHGGPLLNVNESKPYAFTAAVRAGATRAEIQGAIDHPFHLDKLSATARFSGDNLADLYLLTGVVLPATPPYHISGSLRRDGDFYTFTNVAGLVGHSDLGGFLTVDVKGKVPDLRGRLSSRTLDFNDLGALFRGGKPAPAAGPWLLPDTVLHTEKLRQIEAEVDYQADSIASRDFPLKGLATHISVENAVLTLKPLAFAFSAGKLSGSLTIDARHNVPVTGVDARITDIHVEHFIQGAEKPVSGTMEARAKLTGSGSSVHQVASTANGTATFVVPSGEIKSSLAQWLGVNVISALGLTLTGDNSRTPIRCAVADFAVKDGVLSAQHFVFDTEPVRVDGSGVINLKNETLNLTLQGKPKTFQFVRLKAPIRVTGSLAHPSLGVSANQAIAQGAIGAGLGILSPLAALFAFIDPGLAKDANCTAALSDAKAQGAPVKNAALRHAAAKDAAAEHK
jgi:uncharacterized protein involved in outer membrane biogenesis